MSVKWFALAPLTCGAACLLYNAYTHYKHTLFTTGKRKRSKALRAKSKKSVADVAPSSVPSTAPILEETKHESKAEATTSIAVVDEETEDAIAVRTLNAEVGLGSGIITTVLACAVGYPYFQVEQPLTNSNARLRFALSWEMWSLLPLMGSVTYVGYQRFLCRHQQPPQPTGSAPANPLKKYQRLARHNLEQTVLAVPVHVMLAWYLTDKQVHLLPLLICVYLSGQILYAQEYISAETDEERETAGSYGYAMALSSTVFALVSCVGFFTASLLK